MPASRTGITPAMMPVAPSTGKLQPLRLDEVTLTDGFWADAQRRNRLTTIPHVLHWLEKAGWIGNFDAAADGRLPADRRGREFSDSEVYKGLEAVVWELALTPDADLQARYDTIVARVAAAQEPDGYLNTQFGRPGQQPRYSDLEWGHELYCYGHLLQAAAARLRTGHDDELVDVARGVADHICATFGPGGIESVCGHAEVELGLVEFGRATGDRRYIEQASLFLDRRGHQTLEDIEWGRAYFQDDIPIRDADTLRGHAVRALYLSAAAVDVAVEHQDDTLLEPVIRQWHSAIARRTYITGGMGSQHQDEGFGADFALPSDRSYSETCAGVAAVMLSWRLLLATGDWTYADVTERTLFNVVAASPDLAGGAFFYTNTLQQRSPGSVPAADEQVPRASSSLRAPWFKVSCCPPNVARTLASLGGYVATKDADGIQLHQYASCTIDTELAERGRVSLRVDTDYPRSGEIEIRSTGPSIGPWSLTLRIPSWAEGAVLTDSSGTRTVSPGVVTVTDTFDEPVRLTLPVAPRFSYPDPRIDGIRGTVAVERGPLVLCVESHDLPVSDDVEDARLDVTRPPVDVLTTPTGAEPWVTVHGSIRGHADPAWPYSPAPAEPSTSSPAEFGLIPYYLWANRGPATMRVWLPVDAAS